MMSSELIRFQKRKTLPDETSSVSPIELATELTIAWLGNPNTRTSSDEVPIFLSKMHEAVLNLGRGANNASTGEPVQDFTPATTVRRSLASKDQIISLIDGKPYKTLRRHLSTHGLTPEQYRERYKLKPDYPMVAPTYSEARRSMAQKIGLGRKSTARPIGTAIEASPVSVSARPERTPSVAPSINGATPKAPARRGRQPKGAPPE
jgi:predicted transcriptional regulator